MKNKQNRKIYNKIKQNNDIDSNSKKRNTIESDMPLNTKAKMNLASNNPVSYEKQAKKILSALKLRSTFTGMSNKKLIFSGLALLTFCGIGDLVTGSNVHAINLDQVICITKNQVFSIEPDSNKISEANPTNKLTLSSPKTELVNPTTVTTSEEKQQVPRQQPTTALNQKTEVSPAKRPRLNQSPADFTDAAVNTKEQQTTVLNQKTEVRPAKRSRLNQSPADSTDAAVNTKEQPKLNQLQPVTTGEIATTVQSSNTLRGLIETHTVTTDGQKEQSGLNKEQILDTTHVMTDTTQTVPDTATTPITTLSDGTITDPSSNLINPVSINQLSNNKKLYYLEALNLCNPFIEKETKVIENVRLYNGYTDSIVMKGNSYARNYSKDGGIGSSNLMKILFPSISGELNINTTSNITNLSKCEPSPEDIANLIICLFKYRNNDPETIARFTLLNKWTEFGKGFVNSQCPIVKEANPPTYDYDSFFQKTLSNESVFAKQYGDALKKIKEKLSKITNLENRKKQLYYDLLNYERDTTLVEKKENKKIATFFSIIQNAIHMIDYQEKNDKPEDKNIRIFPKYAAERFILCYFIDKFDKNEQIASFYSKLTEQLNNISLANERIVTGEELNIAKKRLEETLPILNKYRKNRFSPYERTTVQNGTCYLIKPIAKNTISFEAETFSDCADIAVRHVMNLLIYSQGVNKNLTDPWADVLPEKGSDQERDIQLKLNEVKNAIKNKGTPMALYPLKDRLQMFFLHQKEVGVDKSDDVTRTLWEYVICNLTEENNGFAPLRYNRIDYELYPGYKNMLTFMCRCAQELFPEKDIKNAYEEIQNCSEYEYNQDLISAIKAVFKLFNECDCDVKKNKNGVKIIYHELDNINFSIFQSNDHAQIDHNPSTMDQLTAQEINTVKKSKNDFTLLLINLPSHEKIYLQEDFYRLFSGESLNWDYYRKKFNFGLSSRKVVTSNFLSRYHALKFLKCAQGAESNSARIQELLQTYCIYSSRIRSCLNMQIDNNKVDVSNFIFDRYINSLNTFEIFSNGPKTFEFINSTNEININSFGNNLALTQENTNTAFRYTLDENGNAILYPVEDKENLYIPSTITVCKNKIKVAGLGKFACYNFKVLSKVTIDNTENEAESTTDLKIGDYAFYECSNLNLITHLNKNVNKLTIGKYAFSNSTIKSVCMPKNLKKLIIDEGAFFQCINLTNFDISLLNMLEDFYIGLEAFKGTAIESITIPINVSTLTIDTSAFENCEKLESFNLSSSEKLENLNIKHYAFKESTIKSVILPKNLKKLTIGMEAFFQCVNLTDFDLSLLNSLENLHIDSDAFDQTSIGLLVIPKNVKILEIIGNDSQIPDLSIYEKIETLYIGERFPNDIITTPILLPKNIKNLIIVEAAFYTRKNFKTLDLSLYIKLETICIEDSAFESSAIESIILPKNIKKLTIKARAFSYCSSLKSITIPESVTELNLDRESFPLDCTVRVPERFKEQLETLGSLSYKIEYYKTESAS